MKMEHTSNQSVKAIPELPTYVKTLDQVERFHKTDCSGDVTLKLRDSPWQLTDDQLSRLSLSKLSKGLAAIPSSITFEMYLRWLEVQRTAPKNNFNGDWTGVIAQWTQSLRARGFTLDEIIENVLKWGDSHRIVEKFIKELENFEAKAQTGVKPRQPPTPEMLGRGWARILEGAAGSKVKGLAGTASQSSKPLTALSRQQGLSCSIKESPKHSTLFAVPMTLTPTTDLNALPNGQPWQQARVGPTRDAYGPSAVDEQQLSTDIALDSLLSSNTFTRQKALLGPVGGTHRPSNAKVNPKLTVASVADSQKPSAAEAKPPSQGGDTWRPIFPSTSEQALANLSGNPRVPSTPRATPRGQNKHLTKVAYYESMPSLIKPPMAAPMTYICRRCQNPGRAFGIRSPVL
jgi:hypothetical protein